jgi:hypothetical protein
MSTQNDDYNTLELRRMSEEEARNQLTVDEYERWEKLTDLKDGYDETKDRWDDEDETVAALTVHADADALGTDVELYGNDALVHVDSESEAFRDAADRLEGALGDTDPDDIDALDDADTDAAADALLDMLDAVLIRWNGTEWDELSQGQRQTALQQMRSKWGLDALLMAWFDIAAAVAEDRQDRVDVIESFRSPERRGRR